MKRTFYVELTYTYEEIEVEAASKEEAEKEAREIVKRGWIGPSFVDVRVIEE
jgi:hypothetical protein